ncbi:serine hydrolase [Rheinheimera sp.]|uniref:serine hydrolase domain-containing protein n=1 Tax=Rheinheimera sp. TaxID=1869214 RepID=UPI00307E386B
MNTLRFSLLTAWITWALAGCGGGGDATSSPTAPPVQTTVNWQVTQDPPGWSVLSAQSAAMDPTRLHQAYQQAAGLPSCFAMLVARRGALVAEAYFAGKTQQDLLQLRSVTKTLLGALTGIAIERQELQSVQQPLSELMPARYLQLLSDKADIRLWHLLTMTSGLDWDESTAAGYNNWVLAAEPVLYVLQRPQSSAAGSRFNYNSGASDLISVALQQQTGWPVADYARQFLFAPLGISQWTWETFADGHNNGSAGLSLNARDLTKLGVVLTQGRWQQQQLIPAYWLTDASTAQVQLQRTLGPMQLHGYGYLWWIGQLAGQQVRVAWGHGGQFVILAPDLDLVVTILQNHQNVTATQEQHAIALAELVLQAAL